MFKIDLQLFAEAVRGKKLVYLYRILEDASTTAGATLAFTSENERTASKDSDTTITKDGSIRTPGETEVEITATSLLKKGDSLVYDLEEAMYKDKIIEIWEANLEEPVASKENQFKGKYFQGYLTEVGYSSSAEDYVEVSLTFAINGTGESGDVTVTEAQQQAAYAFADTTQSTDA